MPTKKEQKVIDEFDSRWTVEHLGFLDNSAIKTFILEALRNKEKEVWERVKECVPFSQMHTLPDGVNSRHETEYDRGWNKCRELTLANIKNLSK